MTPRIAILASGEGTTAETIIRASAEKRIRPEVELVICSREQAGILKRVEGLNREYGLNIACALINARTHPAADSEKVAPGCQTQAEEKAILNMLSNGQFDAIFLLGYMKRVGPKLVRKFGWRPDYTSPYQATMVNTHPGLLPDTKGTYGIHSQEYVLSQGLPYAGQVLHIVAEDYDDGPVVAEHKVKVLPDDTPETLFARVQQTEKQHIPYELEAFITARQRYLMHPVGR